MYKPISYYLYDQISDYTPKLVSCWEVVCGNHSYTTTQRDKEKNPDNMYCAIRVLSGSGKLITENSILPLEQNCLVVLKSEDVVRYASVSDVWIYIWYNFTSGQPLPFFEEGRLYDLSIDKNENETRTEMFDALKEYSATSNQLANLLFSAQLYRWIHRLETLKQSVLPYYDEIRQATDYINEHLTEPINMAELARRYNFSERHFRQLFSSFTGYSPKAYQQYVKLKNAAALLKSTNMQISEIADNLGFYSQFQFCRDFKTHFGLSPTEYRNK